MDKTISNQTHASVKKKLMKRNNLQNVVRFLIKHLTHTEFIGAENLPAEGGILIATNHISRLDIPVLFTTPVRYDITALVADKYLKYPFFRWFTIMAGGIWLDRSKADFSAFSQALTLLQHGRALGIAPEGTRSDTAELLEGKPGTVLLAHRARVPIVPVGITGSQSVLKNLLKLRKVQILVRYGKPIHLPPFSYENREEDLKRQTDEVMCHIAALLPESYRGFYKDHPRLKELLAEEI